MGLTPKQERNGIPEMGPAGGNVAQPGPMPDLAGLQRQAENAGNARMLDGKALITSPQGSGVDGHELGNRGNMYEWDAGLAVNDVEGGGSG